MIRRRIWSSLNVVSFVCNGYVSFTTNPFPVDAAIAEVDDQLRIAYVAAFAMSNYSSTIGRIAKPFNPMLVCSSFRMLYWFLNLFQGETFEYVRLDKSYRYYSEQVSHHPPISACWAEGQDWRYYGEVRSIMHSSCASRSDGFCSRLMHRINSWASPLRSDQLVSHMPN